MQNVKGYFAYYAGKYSRDELLSVFERMDQRYSLTFPKIVFGEQFPLTCSDFQSNLPSISKSETLSYRSIYLSLIFNNLCHCYGLNKMLWLPKWLQQAAGHENMLQAPEVVADSV